MPLDKGASVPSLSPAERAAAWAREDPAELRRSADEWDDLGYREYAAYLRARADGRTVAFVAPPW